MHFKLISTFLGEQKLNEIDIFTNFLAIFPVIFTLSGASSSRVLELGDRFLDVRSEGNEA
jgi:hypothetical protein